MNPSILIVVPTLNSFLLLPRLFSSLQSQSFREWRLLFVDGHSGSQHRQWLDHCCSVEPRCNWISQDACQSGIFGAMNHGFRYALSNEWVLFWGSDDFAPSSDVLANIANTLRQSLSSGVKPDLLVCRGRYIEPSTSVLARAARFDASGVINRSVYTRSLMLGSTPPHQATVFGPGARQLVACYSVGFRLTADLDYFLRLSFYSDLVVQCLDYEIVYMSIGGVSSQQNLRRFYEVFIAYKRAFGWYCVIPFVSRYLRRVLTMLA